MTASCYVYDFNVRKREDGLWYTALDAILCYIMPILCYIVPKRENWEQSFDISDRKPIEKEKQNTKV